LRPRRVLAPVPRIPLRGMLQRLERRPLALSQIVERGWIRWREGRHQVDPDEAIVVELGHARANAGSPIAALREVAVVSETSHQLAPRTSDPLHAPPGPRGLIAEPVA